MHIPSESLNFKSITPWKAFQGAIFNYELLSSNRKFPAPKIMDVPDANDHQCLLSGINHWEEHAREYFADLKGDLLEQDTIPQTNAEQFEKENRNERL